MECAGHDDFGRRRPRRGVARARTDLHGVAPAPIIGSWTPMPSVCDPLATGAGASLPP